MTTSEEIDRQARAWQAQLQDQGLRPTDAYRIAQREAGWQGWALAERQAARQPKRITAARHLRRHSARSWPKSAPEPEAGS